MNILLIAVAIVGGAIAGLLIARFWRGAATDPAATDATVAKLRSAAEADAAELRRAAELAGQELAQKRKAELDDELRTRRTELTRREEGLTQRERELDRAKKDADRRGGELDKRERSADGKAKQIDAALEKAEAAQASAKQRLEEVAGLSADAARARLEESVRSQAHAAAAVEVKRITEDAERESQARAKTIIATAIQRYASEFVHERTVAVVPLPSDDMKGRLIGREGRNIRAFEQFTGVDIIVDDTPEAVTLSCHDPVRREVARVALIKLLKDGRIHPSRIEEVVQKTQVEIDQVMREEGERVAYEANVQGLHPDLIKLLGRLKYRTSYGQNVLHHSLECSLLAAHMAAELGANINVAKTAALLHDIGKAVDHEVQGPHAMIGADIARRLGRSPAIVHAIAGHHHDEEPTTVEAFLVIAADAISGGRPGARRETLDLYIKRLEALETVATSFPGVQRAFAVQAGREVRVMVQPEQIDDLASIHLARDVAKKIEESLQYPGQIKVTIIRETRAVDYAR